MNTQTVSAERIAITRKNAATIQSVILRRLSQVTQERAAAFMGVSASTISRSKDDLEKVCLLLSALGMQVAPRSAVVYTSQERKAYQIMAFKWLQAQIEAEAEEGEEF